jgi:hypothetical protein
VVVEAGLVGIAFHLLLRERRREVRENQLFCLGTLPDFLVTIPLGDYVTREEVVAVRVKHSS